MRLQFFDVEDDENPSVEISSSDEDDCVARIKINYSDGAAHLSREEAMALSQFLQQLSFH